MTDRTEAKRKERARAKAGYKFCCGYAHEGKSDEIQSQLMSADEVDEKIRSEK